MPFNYLLCGFPINKKSPHFATSFLAAFWILHLYLHILINYTVGKKEFNKTLCMEQNYLITGGVGGAGVDPLSWKTDTVCKSKIVHPYFTWIFCWILNNERSYLVQTSHGVCKDVFGHSHPLATPSSHNPPPKSSMRILCQLGSSTNRSFFGE